MARQIQPLAGQKFGRLIVIRLNHKDKKSGLYYWKCWCECGNYCVVAGARLKNGTVTSCGCAQKEARIKHGLTGTRLNNIYRNIIARCEYPDHPSYKYYGQRGIKMCPQWRSDPIEFFRWATTHGYADNLTIDRIDSSKDYEPDNCRWVDWFTQANNLKTNIRITYFGHNKTLAEWARALHIDYNRLYGNFREKNLSFEQAVEQCVLIAEYKGEDTTELHKAIDYYATTKPEDVVESSTTPAVWKDEIIDNPSTDGESITSSDSDNNINDDRNVD